MTSLSSLKLVNDDKANEMMMNAPMRIRDAVSMMTYDVKENDKPYDKMAIQGNNALVEEWRDAVLNHICDDAGTVPATRIDRCLTFFVRGKAMLQKKNHAEWIPRASQDVVDHWIRVLSELSVKELHRDYGLQVCADAWHIVNTAIQDKVDEEQWGAVYSKTRDPLEWDRLANKNGKLMSGGGGFTFPFGLDRKRLEDMGDKITSLMSNKLIPRNK